jgi:hypothetical protein
MEFKIGEEIWWFRIDSNGNELRSPYFAVGLNNIELVHDIVKKDSSANDEQVCGFYTIIYKTYICGKTRQEAFNSLKQYLEKWGPL